MSAVWTITYDAGGGAVEKAAADWGLNANPVILTRDRMPTRMSFRLAGAAPEGTPPFPFLAAVTIRQNRTYSGGAWSGSGYVFKGFQTSQKGRVDGKAQGVMLDFHDTIWLLQNTSFQQLWAQAIVTGGAFVTGKVYRIETVGTTNFMAIGAAANTVGVVFTATGAGSGSGTAKLCLPVSRCVLFMDITNWTPNTYKSVQWQIQEVITWANACGIALQAGTIELSGWFLNYYACRAQSCWDVILKCLEPIPDVKVWVDNSTTPPSLHVRTRASLAALSTPATTGPGPVTLPYKGSDAAGRVHYSSELTPRYDLIPPQVVIQYQTANVVDGESRPTWTYDSYYESPAGVGHTDGAGQVPFALVVPVDLAGATVKTTTAQLDCEPLACLGGTHAARRAWWAGHRGGSQHKLGDFRTRFQDSSGNAVDLADAIILNEAGADITSTVLATYPNRIVKGTAHSWMKNGSTAVQSIRVTVKAKAQCVEYDVPGTTPAETDTNGNVVKPSNTREFSVRLTLTNAPSGVTNFQTADVSSYAETPVNDLAKNIYLARQTLDYDGVHEIVDPGNATTAPLAVILGHWNVLNLSGGAAAWATANLTIAGTEIDLMTNHQRIDIGPAKHLSPQDWNQLLQFFRHRLPLSPATTRATGVAAENGVVEMPRATPDENSDQGLSNLRSNVATYYATESDPTSTLRARSNLDAKLHYNILLDADAGAAPTPASANNGVSTFNATDVKTLAPRQVSFKDNSGAWRTMSVHCSGAFTRSNPDHVPIVIAGGGSGGITWGGEWQPSTAYAAQTLVTINTGTSGDGTWVSDYDVPDTVASPSSEPIEPVSGKPYWHKLPTTAPA